MNDWLESNLGRYVVRQESQLARVAFEDVFGFDLLQVGSWGPSHFLCAESRTQRATIVADDEQADVRGELDALPIAPISVDAVLLPHTLERVDDPYAVLREADRILRPDGLLLVLGFNPWSGWGVRRLVGRGFRRAVFPPGCRRLLSERRLRDWVSLLGFEVERVSGYLGVLPVARATPDTRYRQKPALVSGAYLLKARKRVGTLTALRPKWPARQRVMVGAAEPTTKMPH